MRRLLIEEPHWPPGVTSRFTLAQVRAFLHKPKAPKAAAILATPTHAANYARARWEHHQSRDPWGNAPLSVEDWAAGKHLKE